MDLLEKHHLKLALKYHRVVVDSGMGSAIHLDIVNGLWIVEWMDSWAMGCALYSTIWMDILN